MTVQLQRKQISVIGGVQRRPRRRRVRWQQALFILPVAIYLALMFAYPVGFELLLSFKRYDLRSIVTGISDWVGLGNIQEALASREFRRAALNSGIFTLASMVIQLIIGMALALFFYKKFPLSTAIRALLILPWLVPSIVATTAWRFMLREPNGFINQALHVFGLPTVRWLTTPNMALVSVIIVNIWIGVAFNMVLLHSGLQSIPTELLEAATVDGAGYWRRVYHIMLPALRPVLAVVFTLGFVYTLKQFDIVWTLTKGGPGNGSQVLSTWSYTAAFVQNQFGMGAAIADFLFVASGIIIVIYSIWTGRRARA
jgi:multiple sugar transport system permease protein